MFLTLRDAARRREQSDSERSASLWNFTVSSLTASLRVQYSSIADVLEIWNGLSQQQAGEFASHLGVQQEGLHALALQALEQAHPKAACCRLHRSYAQAQFTLGVFRYPKARVTLLLLVCNPDLCPQYLYIEADLSIC